MSRPAQPNGAAQTASYFLFYIGIGLILSSLGPSLPALSAQTGASLVQLGGLFTALSLGRIVGAFTLGSQFDRKPAHPLMAALMAGMAILLTVAPLILSLALLLAIFFVIGIAWGGLDVAVNTLLAWIWGKRSGQFLSGLHMFFGLGAIVAPFAVNASILFSENVRFAYWAFAALLFLNAFWLRLTASPAIQLPPLRSATVNTHWLFVSGIVLLIMICVGEEVAFSGWIFSYMIESGFALQNQAILLNSLFWVSLTFGRLVSIPLSTWFSPQRLLLLDLLGCLVAVGMVLIWPNSPPVVWTGTMLLGFSVASVFPMVIVFTQQHIPLTGRITSLIMIGDGVGGMIFPWLAGYLFEKYSPPVMILQIFMSFLTALLIFTALSFSRRVPGAQRDQQARLSA